MARVFMFVLLALVGASSMTETFAQEPTVVVTKDKDFYYKNPCAEKIASNDLGLPVEVVKEAIENGKAETAYKPAGFGGLSMKKKEASYANSYLDVQPMPDKKTNVGMLAVFIFGFFFIAITSLRQVKAIPPKTFWGGLYASGGALIGILTMGGLLSAMSSFWSVPDWTMTLALLCSLITGLLVGLMIGLSRKQEDPEVRLATADVLSAIRDRDTSPAESVLINRFNLSSRQAKTVLRMKVKELTKKSTLVLSNNGPMKFCYFAILPLFCVVLPLLFGGLSGMLFMLCLLAAALTATLLASALIKAIVVRRKVRRDRPQTPVAPAA
jgi:hypothetical protein